MGKFFIKKKDYPCKNCRERVIGCHSTCEKYKAVKAEREKIQHLIELNVEAAVFRANMVNEAMAKKAKRGKCGCLGRRRKND